MLEIVATQECLKRILAVREGKNPYPENQRQFWWALETADRESLGDSYADFYDPRLLNRQVLEASGFIVDDIREMAVRNNELELLCDKNDRHIWKPFISGSRYDVPVELRTIGDFRRFCSLPGIEIDVIVPEDYDQNA